MRLLLLTAFFIFFCAGISQPALANKRKVLFIGNSFTFTNDLPSMLQQMATAMGDTLNFDQSVYGGYTLEMHSTDAQTISKIFSQQWDIVVLQEQSQKPAFDPAQVAAETFPYAHILDSMVRASGTCTETMFFMTWGYRNGDASNCPFYPPICTYNGMQQRLRESYVQMAANENGTVSPVGAAWKVVRDSFPSLNLYSPDNMHPGVNGTYLAACVFYAAVFHNSPYGCTYMPAGVNTADAASMQRIAARVTLDSIAQWQTYRNYVQSAFKATISNKTATFQNLSRKAASYYWTFGDGTTSTQTAPVHTYATSGNYPVTLRATNNCFTEVHKDTVHIAGSGGIGSVLSKENTIVNYDNSTVSIQLPDNAGTARFELFSLNGQKLCSNKVQAGFNRLPFTAAPGIYIYSISNDGQTGVTGKLVVR